MQKKKTPQGGSWQMKVFVVRIPELHDAGSIPRFQRYNWILFRQVDFCLVTWSLYTYTLRKPKISPTYQKKNHHLNQQNWEEKTVCEVRFVDLTIQVMVVWHLLWNPTELHRKPGFFPQPQSTREACSTAMPREKPHPTCSE